MGCSDLFSHTHTQLGSVRPKGVYITQSNENILWFYQSGMNCLSSFVVQFTLFLLYILSILAMHTYAHYFICNLVFYILVNVKI